jgi:hypothetical protein
MRSRSIALLLCGATMLVFSQAPTQERSPQSPAPCDTPEARQFDFWVGHWDIAQRILRADGSWVELPATTVVSKDLEGCALVEHWEGTVQFFWEGMQEPLALHGLSVRAYDPTSRRWRIHWMDTRHPTFGTFEGGFEKGTGTFLKSSTGADGKPLLTRITFSDITDESVHWSLAISRDEGAAWTTLWIMDMRRIR